MKATDLLKGMEDFCEASLKWCQAESEKSILLVNEVLNKMVEDATRVSNISAETIDAIDSVREIINSLGKERDRAAANDLAKAINKVAEENSEVNEFIAPLLESLQFQDRVTQNMDNVGKMIRAYVKFRKELAESGEFFTEDKQTDFGKKMLECTTMVSEREIVHHYIPNLPMDKETTEDVLFF